MTKLLRNLAKTTTRRPGVSIAVLLVLLVGAIGGGISAGGKTVDDFTVPGLEYQKAEDLIAGRFPGQDGDSATIVLTTKSGTLRSPDRAAGIAAAMSMIGNQPHVSSVEDPLSSGHVARDGRTAFATVSYDAKASDLKKAPRERLEKAAAPLATAGVDVALSGLIVDAGSEGEAPIGELAGLLVALILLFVVLRSARAALSAMLTAFLGVGLGFAMLGLAANGVDIPSLAPTVAALLGLGAGIDYALLSASRQQEELRAGRSPSEAAIRTNETAGHSAVTAAFIVLASISGLLVTGIPFLGKVGVAAGVMVLLTALVAVLLLPPLLTAGGRKILPRRERAQPVNASTDPVRAGFAVRRPWIALAVGALVAAVLIVPAAGLTIGQPDDGNLASDQTQRQAYDQLAAAFGPGFSRPLVVAIDAGAAGVTRQAAATLRRRIAQRPDVASVGDPTYSERGDTALLTVFPRSSPQSDETAGLVRDLRDVTIPATLRGTGARAVVGGLTARLVDEAKRISDRLPLFAVVVVGLSLLLLVLTFRSLTIAVLSAVFNLISIAAAYGVIYLLFQTDGGASLIGVEVQPVVAYTPLFMFAILFGLSTDYNVFLLSRVREEYERRGRVMPAIAEASARTRRTITAAGIIMIVVFLGFTTAPDATIKSTGYGLASAILIDITIVRLLLAPAALTLLGDRLWRRQD